MAKFQFNRRHFIEWGAGAAALEAAGRVIRLDPAQASPDPYPAGAGQGLRFASIGTGVRGCEDLSTAISCGADMVATCDLYDARFIAAEEHAGKKLPTTKRYQEILERPDVDFIIVTTPDHWHAKIVEDACAAGKDVYCEKPMTHHVAEGFRIIDAVRRHNRIIQVGSQETSSIVYQKARDIYQSGALGLVTAIEAWIDRNGPSGAWDYPIPPGAGPENIDWNTFLGDAPKRPFSLSRFFRWRGYSDYGEGLPGDLFVHLLTGIYTVTGLNAPPLRALSTGGLFRWKYSGRDEPDLLETFFDFPDFRVMVRCNQNNNYARQIVRIFGTQGTLEIDGDGRISLIPQDNTPRPENYSTQGWPAKLRNEYLAEWHAKHPATAPGDFKMVDDTVTYRAPDGYDEDRDHMTTFLKAVHTRQKPMEDAEFGNWTSIACLMANYSYFKKTIAVWDEASKTIKG